MYNNKSDKILTLMYPKLSRKYVETKGDKVDDKTFRRLRLILNSKYGLMGVKKFQDFRKKNKEEVEEDLNEESIKTSKSQRTDNLWTVNSGKLSPIGR